MITNVSYSAGYQTPRALLKAMRWFPTAFDVRIENLLNQRLPVNLGSPFQGTRFNLPLRVSSQLPVAVGQRRGKAEQLAETSASLQETTALLAGAC